MAKKKTEAVAELLEVERDGKGRIKSHLRDKWLVEPGVCLDDLCIRRW